LLSLPDVEIVGEATDGLEAPVTASVMLRSGTLTLPGAPGL
jgi:hypothetical protein